MNRSHSSPGSVNADEQRHRNRKSRRLFPTIFLPSLFLFCVILYNHGVRKLLTLPKRPYARHLNANSDTNRTAAVDSHIRHVPYLKNRFRTPWNIPDRIRFLTLQESHHRIIYSSLRETASDGIGHGFGIMNAEIGAALRLGLSYSHRIATHASLTFDDPDAIEKFFGWAQDEIPRSIVRDHFCRTQYHGNPMQCQICSSTKPSTLYPSVQFQQVVELPQHLTYMRAKCPPDESRKLDVICADPIVEFLRDNSAPNTIFQMPIDSCAISPVDSYVDPAARSVIFHKYWDLHGDSAAIYPKSKPSGLRIAQRKGQLPRYSISTPRATVNFSEHELVFAVHARRGDFFDVQRNMVSLETFAAVVRNIMRIVHAHGGIFSRIPVAIHVYSEGRPRDGRRVGHDVRHMTDELLDADGVIRDEEWLRNAFLNATTASRDGVGQRLFAHGLAVRTHVATDTLQSLHDMIAADVFVGSDSGMSRYIVTTLSRGALQLVPMSYDCVETEVCHKSFDAYSGELWDEAAVRDMWRAFAKANAFSTSRAAYRRRFFSS